MDPHSGKKHARRYGEHYFIRESADNDWKRVTKEEHNGHRKLDEEGNKLRTMRTLSQREKPNYVPLVKSTGSPTNASNDNRGMNSRSDKDVDRSYSDRARNDRSRPRDRRVPTSSQRSRGSSPNQLTRYDGRAERSSEANQHEQSPERSVYNNGNSERRRDSDIYRPERRRSRSPGHLAYDTGYSEPRRNPDNYWQQRREAEARTPRGIVIEVGYGVRILIDEARTRQGFRTDYRERRSPDRRSEDYHGEFGRQYSRI